MTEPFLLEQAKQGDPQAIAALMNNALQPKGMTAYVERQGDRLEVVLKAERIPNRQSLTDFVERGIETLGVQDIRIIEVSGQQFYAASPAWTQELLLEEQSDTELNAQQIQRFSKSGVGEVVEAIAPNKRGRVKFGGSYWSAQLYPEAQTQVLPSEQVSVVGRDGITLLVTPITASVQAENTSSTVGQSRDRESETKLVINRHRRQAQYFVEDLGDEVTLEMVLIPSGSFVMGALEDEEESEDNERPQHTVTVQSFCMGKYPVTQALWKVVAALPQVNRELDPDPSRFKGENRPVEQVSWYEAVEFCDRLSRKTGRDYRLPSEAEWEYACRAGTTTPFHFGETITPDLANYDGNYTYNAGSEGTYREETTAVGSFGVANAFGLYDMHGNVWEWCLDHWYDSYKGAPIDGSAWLSDKESSYRLLRGGSWYSNPRRCRSAYRDNDGPGYWLNYIGFRVVCSSAWTL
jgi:formylglycine-generating enzyme required for sulfatase activity